MQKQPVLPLTWVVVDVENNSNLLWVLKFLSDGLHIGDSGGLTIISISIRLFFIVDLHGLVKFAKAGLCIVEHRQCTRHVYLNFKKPYHVLDYKRLFWTTTTSSTVKGVKPHK
ncbi:hypothetical protein LXL04_015548 [Taraxacum kok-saghyz]